MKGIVMEVTGKYAIILTRTDCSKNKSTTRHDARR